MFSSNYKESVWTPKKAASSVGPLDGWSNKYEKGNEQQAQTI